MVLKLIIIMGIIVIVENHTYPVYGYYSEIQRPNAGYVLFFIEIHM